MRPSILSIINTFGVLKSEKTLHVYDLNHLSKIRRRPPVAQKEGNVLHGATKVTHLHMY